MFAKLKLRLFLELQTHLRGVVIILNIATARDEWMARTRDHDMVIFCQEKHVLTAQTISIYVTHSVVVSSRNCCAALL